jgi:hypothetical protein
MEMRKAAITVAGILSGFCLAAALGCGGRKIYLTPPVITNVTTANGTSLQDGITYPVAAVNTTVILQGGNYDDVNAVSFGGFPAGYHIDNDSQLTAVVPLAAISGPITVANGAGLAESHPSLLIQPAVTGSSASVTPGSNVTLNGNGLFGDSSITFTSASGTLPGTTTNSVTGNGLTLTVLVPAGAIAGPVQLTVSGLPANAVTAAADPDHAGNLILTAN